MGRFSLTRSKHWSPPLAAFAVFLAAAAVMMFRLGELGLIEPDEARYASVARAMVDTGDFVTPRINDYIYLDKPPMLHWLTAASFTVLGPTEFAARLFPALATAAGIALVYAIGRHGFGHKAGILSALVMLTCVLWFAVGRTIRFDMLLSLAIAATVWWAWLGTESGPRARLYFLLAATVMGLGVLVKGPVAAALPGAILLVYLAVTRRLKVLAQVPWLRALGLFALVAVPWFVAVELATPGAVRFFMVHENLSRVTGTMDTMHWEPWWYFGPVLLMAAVPWTLYLPGAIYAGVHPTEQEHHRRRLSLLLIIWAAVVVGLFSLSKVKLPAYILPAMPAVAVLVGRYVAGRDGRLCWAGGATGAALVAAGAAVWVFAAEPVARLGLDAAIFVPALAAALIVSGLGVVGCAHLRQGALGATVLAVGLLATLNIAILGVERIDSPVSDRLAAQALASLRRPGEPIVCYEIFSRGALFYLNEPLTIVARVPREFEFAGNAPRISERTVPRGETAQWLREAPVHIGLCRSKYWEELQGLAPGHVRPLGTAGKHVIFRTMPNARASNDPEGDAP